VFAFEHTDRRHRGIANGLEVRARGVAGWHPSNQQLGEAEDDRKFIPQLMIAHGEPPLFLGSRRPALQDQSPVPPQGEVWENGRQPQLGASPLMPHVVLADDHALVREGVRRILEANGIPVAGEVGDGLRVLEAVERLQPDVLLLDLGLPGLHGLDILREVTRRAPSTRVLVLSADGRDDFVVRALRNGAAGYLLKGCQAEELVRAVTEVAAGGYHLSSSLSASLARAVGEEGGGTAAPAYESLTPREREVFHLMAEGLANAAIAERLFISGRTVETHRANIMRKLGLRTQTDVVLLALRRGILTIEG
jgi:DNA-binding NarL/FixJ family response regulator